MIIIPETGRLRSQKFVCNCKNPARVRVAIRVASQQQIASCQTTYARQCFCRALVLFLVPLCTALQISSTHTHTHTCKWHSLTFDSWTTRVLCNNTNLDESTAKARYASLRVSGVVQSSNSFPVKSAIVLQGSCLNAASKATKVVIGPGDASSHSRNSVLVLTTSTESERYV
jgi:hypothetical protein